MTIRAALLILKAVLSAGLAAACELTPDGRPGATADYVEAAQACLVSPPEGYWFDADQERRVFDLVNEERRERGLPALAYRPELVAAARFHSLDMAVNDFFDHSGPDARTHADRIAALDRRLFSQASRENLAAVQGPFDLDGAPEILHAILMESPGHRENILASNIDYAGFGVVLREEGAWITQVFVKQAGVLSDDAPLRVAPGEAFGLQADLIDWSFGGFLLGVGERAVDFVADAAGAVRVPTGVAGDAILNAYGERSLDPAGRRYEFINLPGPSVTVAR